MMKRGSLHAGNSHMNSTVREQSWTNETMPNLQASDQLWAYAIRAHDELRLLEADQYGPVDDPVLVRLFQLGLYDWKGLDSRSDEETVSMRQATTLAMRMMKRTLRLEQQVSLKDHSTVV